MKLKVTTFGQWEETKAIVNTMVGSFQLAQRRATLKEAHLMRSEIVQGLRSGAPGGQPFKPLAQTTLAVRKFRGRGGKKPLIVSGALRNSIRVKEEGDVVFVGVLRSAEKGRVNIAEINEFGSRPIVVPITPKSRRFLAAAFRRAGLPPAAPSKTQIAIIRIPPRPFIRPVANGPLFKESAIRSRYEKRLALEMAGKLGTA